MTPEEKEKLLINYSKGSYKDAPEWHRDVEIIKQLGHNNGSLDQFLIHAALRLRNSNINKEDLFTKEERDAVKKANKAWIKKQGWTWPWKWRLWRVARKFGIDLPKPKDSRGNRF